MRLLLKSFSVTKPKKTKFSGSRKSVIFLRSGNLRPQSYYSEHKLSNQKSEAISSKIENFWDTTKTTFLCAKNVRHFYAPEIYDFLMHKR
mgnify:FL=1